MSLFQPKFIDPKTKETKTAETWWYDFTFDKKRFRESTKTTKKTVAKEVEKERRAELERTRAGIQPEAKGRRIYSVAEVVAKYRKNYPLTHRASSDAYSRKRLFWVDKHLGKILLGNLTEDHIFDYIRTRKGEGAAGRTINMELGELSRAIGKGWKVLWRGVKKQDERKDIGRAITPEEETRLLAAASGARLPLIGTFIRVALTTGMRAGEITGLTWERVDLDKRTLRVGLAKTEAGTGRTIPMNQTLFAVISQHAAWFAERFGELKPEWFVFAWGSPTPHDPSRPATNLQSSWENAKERAGVECRFHDLRHTAISRMAEAGAPDTTIMALAGHVSRQMLARYSHISMIGKRKAVEALEAPQTEQAPVAHGKESPKVNRLN